MRRQTIGAALCVAAFLAGCGGKSGNALPPTAPLKPTAKARVQFTMHWPSKTKSASTRKPKYISPATQSVIIAVNSASNPPGPVTFANISQATGNPPTSTINIDAPVGNDDFVIQLFDAQQTSGETTPNGNLVGQTEITETITAGQTNTLNATIDGVAYGVSITPLANQPTVSASQSSGFNVVGTEPVTFQVNALDADGNVIVPPGNAPTTTLAPYGGGVSVNAVSGSANQYRVQVTAAASSTSFPSVYATASDTYGDTSNAIINITPLSAIYVGYTTGNIEMYDGKGNVVALPSAAFGGVQKPVALAFDYDDNYVLVADNGANKLLAFDAAGNPVQGFTPPSVAGINGVTYDANNKLIYVSTTSGISTYTTTGTAASTSASVANAFGIAYVATDANNGALNELAVGIQGSSPAIGIFNESGSQLNSFTVSNPPTGVAYAPYYPGVLRQIFDANTPSGNPAGIIDGFDTGGGNLASLADSNNPSNIAADPNTNDIYVTELSPQPGKIVPYLPDLSAQDSNVPAITTSAQGVNSPISVTIAF